MANKVRGEIEVELCGKKYLLKPEFEGMLEAEDKIGKPLSQIFSQWTTRMPSLREVVAIIYGGLLWERDLKDRALSFDQIGKMVVETGVAKLFGPAIVVVQRTLVPPKDDDDGADVKKKTSSDDNTLNSSPPPGESTSPLPS